MKLLTDWLTDWLIDWLIDWFHFTLTLKEAQSERKRKEKEMLEKSCPSPLLSCVCSLDVFLSKHKRILISVRQVQNRKCPMTCLHSFFTFGPPAHAHTDTSQMHLLSAQVAQWLALLPHNKKVPGLIPRWNRTFLCGVCMFSSCLCGFLPGALVSSHHQNHAC